MDTPPAPQAMGIIVDGNRRWARKRGLPVWEGHREGAKRVGETIRWAREAGVRSLIFYLFSTENWQRPIEERSQLFELLREFLERDSDIPSDVLVRIAGQKERFPPMLQQKFARLEEARLRIKGGAALAIVFCLSYGGRTEIVHAAQQLAREGRDITERALAQALWTQPISDVDLIVRTGGVRRLSNFLLWQAAYAELYFSDTLWPDFSQAEFTAILQWYAKQERRFGR